MRATLAGLALAAALVVWMLWDSLRDPLWETERS